MYHGLDGLSITEMYSLQFCTLGVQNQGVSNIRCGEGPLAGGTPVPLPARKRTRWSAFYKGTNPIQEDRVNNSHNVPLPNTVTQRDMAVQLSGTMTDSLIH